MKHIFLFRGVEVSVMMKFCNILVLAGRKWQSQSGYSHGNKEEPGNVMFRVIQLCCVISYLFINFIFLSKNVLHLVIKKYSKMYRIVEVH